MQPAKGQILSEVQQCLCRPSNPSQGAVPLQTTQAFLQPSRQPRGNKKTPITWDWPRNIGLLFFLAAFVAKAVVVLPVPVVSVKNSLQWASAPSPAAGQEQGDKKPQGNVRGKWLPPASTSRPTARLNSAMPFPSWPSLALAWPLNLLEVFNTLSCGHCNLFTATPAPCPSYHNLQIFLDDI